MESLFARTANVEVVDCCLPPRSPTNLPDSLVDANPAARSNDLLLPRLLASLVSVTIVGLGVMAIWTRHDYGRTTKLGGAEVVLDGPPAVAMGVCTVLFGLFPLALWFDSRRTAIAWTVLCFVAAGTAFLISLRLRHG